MYISATCFRFCAVSRILRRQDGPTGGQRNCKASGSACSNERRQSPLSPRLDQGAVTTDIIVQCGVRQELRGKGNKSKLESW